MKNMLWLAAAALVAMTSCTKSEETQPDDVQQGKAIGFKTFVNKAVVNDWTKGTPVTSNTYPESGQFGVFAYFTTDAWTSAATPNFMYNQAVTNNAGTYTYSPVKYWPSGTNDKVSFYAYSPYVAADNGVTLPAEMTTSKSGVPVIAYKVPSDVSKQVDLMYASDANKNGGSVALTFNHALTQVKFGAKMNSVLPETTTVTVTSLTVDKVAMSGTMSLDNGDITPTGTADGTFSWTGLTATLNKELGSNSVSLSGSDVLMLLPQTVTAITVNIAYDVTVTDPTLGEITTSYTKGVSLKDAPAWAKGQRVNYELTLDLSSHAVDITPTFGDWGGDDTPTPVN